MAIVLVDEYIFQSCLVLATYKDTISKYDDFESFFSWDMVI
jgi:hypothetical protein